MRFRMRQQHMVDLLFPVALLFMFAVSALAVLLLATKIYRGSVENSARNDAARTSLSYLTEKLHRADEAGSVGLEELSGCPALALRQEYNGMSYVTYIYHYDGQLRELFVRGDVGRNDTALSAGSGRAILPLQSLDIQPLAGSLYRLTCVEEDGSTATAVVGLRSAQEVLP